MLKQRVVTAVVLLAILLPALFYRTPVPFCAVALLLIAAGAWEWARLNSFGQRLSLLSAVCCVLLCGWSWYAGLLDKPLPVLWILGGTCWVLVGGWLLWAGVTGWAGIPRSVRWVAGVLVLWLAWLAVAQARFLGINFLMSVLLLVWVADIFAYFAGRALGGFCQREIGSVDQSWQKLGRSMGRGSRSNAAGLPVDFGRGLWRRRR